MGLLLMLMTFGGLGFAALLLCAAICTKSRFFIKFIIASVATWFIFYGVLLIATSLFSKEKTLSINEPKQYCGFYFDCHLHAAVTGVSKARTFGNKTAKGEFYVIGITIFSDARRAKLGMVSPRFTVIDTYGNEYHRITDPTVSTGDFDRRIPPEGSFAGNLVFDLPVGVKSPRLDIREGNPLDRLVESLIIGDEDSILHKRSYFALDSLSQDGIAAFDH